MNLDERARRAASSVRHQAEQVDTDAILDRVRGTGGRPRWVVPAVAGAGVAAVVILVVALVLPQLQVDRVEIAPDPVVPGDPEPSPTETATSGQVPAVGTWRRVASETFTGPGDQELRAVATDGDVTVAVGTDREQAAVWRNDGDVDVADDWERVAEDLCGEASCELNDVTSGAGRFVAAGTLDGLPKIWHSDDGTSWQRIDLDVPAGASEARLTAVTPDRGGFAAFGSAFVEAGSRPFLVTSADGADWQERPVAFDAVEAGVFAIDAVTYRDAALTLIQIGDGWSFLEPQDDTWTLRDVGTDISPDVALRALAVVGEDLLLTGTQYLGAEEGEPVFLRSPDAREWTPVDSGLRIGSLEEPQAAVAAGPTVMAVGQTRDPAGGAPPHPVYWLELEGRFQALDGGPALHDPGRMIAATSLADGRIVVVGEGREGDDVGEDGDGAVWTFRLAEGSGSPPSTDEADAASWCSAASAGAEPAPQPGLPHPVGDTRHVIREAASSCDLKTLEMLATGGTHGFTYSFGDDGDPTGYWRRLEEEGAQPLLTLPRLLDLPYATVETQAAADEYETVYVWPSAFADDATDADWQAVIDAGLVTEGEAERMRAGEGYTGYRVGIAADGEWVFFVAGD